MSAELNKNKIFKQQFKKRCFYFSLNSLALAEKLQNKRINWSLIDQFIRAATSIGANIVEGGNSTSKKEFVHYFQIALKSASETLYWLSLIKEVNKDYEKEADCLIQENTEIKKVISTIILNTKANSRL